MGFNPRLNPLPMVVNLGATVAAATGDTWALCLAPFAGEIVAAQLVSGANVTGNDTNYTTITIQKGTTVMATRATTVAGGSLVADTATAFVLSTTVANKKFAAGDQLQIVKADTGTGAALTAQTVVTIWIVFGYED